MSTRRPENLGPCIPITQKPDPRGYGRVTVLRFGKIIRYAHILAWVDANGRLPNPETPFICHHCDNPSCINPEHLYEGSPKDNSADMVARRRYRNMQKTHCIHGHEFTEENTFRQANGGRGCRICRRRRAREYLRIQAETEGRKRLPPARDRTHCPQGHPYDETNTIICPDGSRACRTCRREKSRRRAREARDAQRSA